MQNIPLAMQEGYTYIDITGNVVVKYIYDAWGNFAIEQSSNCSQSAIQLGFLNPYRYRGYYYDSENNLYYLQTRYYDPEIGRFISQDST